MTEHAATRALSLLAHRRRDPVSDALMEGMIRALCTPLEPLAAAGAPMTGDRWRSLTDPRQADLRMLPYAAQQIGATVPPRQAGETDDAYLTRAREETTHSRGPFRGSPRAITLAAQAHLTGTRSVRMLERSTGDPWLGTLVVRPSECPDSAAVAAAVNDPAVVPIGVLIDVIVSDSLTWDLATGTWDGHTPSTATWDTYS